MNRKIHWAFGLLILGCVQVACAPIHPVPTPSSATKLISLQVLSAGHPVIGALVIIAPNIGTGTVQGTTDAAGQVTEAVSSAATFASAGVTATGYVGLTVPAGPLPVGDGLFAPAIIELQALLPPAPTRDQALAVTVNFQGLTCHTDQFGDEPLFTPSVPWHIPSDRQQIYACVKAAGNTHIDLMLPSGPALYDECCQFYTADKFGPKDWTANQTAIDPALADLVVEVRQAGLIPILHMDERQPVSTWELGAVLDALATSSYGDIRRQVGLYLPGYDGIFYGWEPSHELIPGWAAVGRQHCPDCQFGIEFNVGHIPLGEGDADYVAGGDMQGFDALFIEFQDRKSVV